MSCVLRIDGINFKVDDFLKSTNLKPYTIYRKGEQTKIGKMKIHNSSGCSFDLSIADFNDFEKQRKDATEFLKNQFDKLKSIYSFGLDNDENPIIDFGTTTRMFEVEIQCDYLEPELLKLAGNLNFGIEISQYHPALEEDEA